MRKGLLGMWVFLTAGAMFALSASAGEPSSSGASAVEATPAPGYSVQVARTGRQLTVSIVPDSREQARTLFGERREHKPTVEIYKGDLLLASGSFAFG